MIQTVTIHIDDSKYALVNHMEIIAYYKLPFFIRWFKKTPVKEFIKL